MIEKVAPELLELVQIVIGPVPEPDLKSHLVQLAQRHSIGLSCQSISAQAARVKAMAQAPVMSAVTSTGRPSA